MSDRNISAEAIAGKLEDAGLDVDSAREWLAEHDAEVKAEALLDFARVVESIAALGTRNTGLRTPYHLAEYAASYAARIERESGGDDE